MSRRPTISWLSTTPPKFYALDFSSHILISPSLHPCSHDLPTTPALYKVLYTTSPRPTSSLLVLRHDQHGNCYHLDHPPSSLTFSVCCCYGFFSVGDNKGSEEACTHDVLKPRLSRYVTGWYGLPLTTALSWYPLYERLLYPSSLLSSSYPLSLNHTLLSPRQSM
jgi:hypothetical protein